jgi:rifampicin phosphotransferase
MSASALIVPLADASDLSQVGGKAINLYRLIQAGLPVPDGFVVTCAAFRQAAALGSMPETLADRIRQAHTSLGQPLVAVRSSATAEDLAGASMAGQYETYLNVTSAEAVIAAVQKCWQSLQVERVQTYLKEQGIDPNEVAVAVVVQKLVPAEVAGVLFTANPRNGDTNEMLVEAVYGLGEGLVSGDIQPDVYCVQADTGQILDLHLANKTKALAPGEHDYQAVPDTQAIKSCLRYDQLQQLCQLGRKAQQHFGSPQDLEWAIDSTGLHLLQARAITTLAATQAYGSLLSETRSFLKGELAQGRGPWVRHNLSETLPLPTPLTWSLIRSFMSGDGGFGQMHSELGFEPTDTVKEHGFLTLIAGQIYMDCTRLPEMFRQDYPFAYDMAALRDNPDAAQQPPTVPSGSYRQRAAAARLGTKVTKKIRDLAQTLDTTFDEQFLPRVVTWCEAQADVDLTSLSDKELIRLWQEQQHTVLDDFGATMFLPSMVEALAAADLKAFLAEHCWDEDPDSLLQQLSVSLKPNVTLQSNIELQEVAQGKRSLDSWLSSYGYRAPGEFDLANPRWTERQEELQSLAAQLADAPAVGECHRAREAETCLKRLKQGLPATLGTALEAHVALLQRYLRFREDGKAVFIRALAQLRRSALEFGRRLALDDAVFFLEAHELVTALQQGFVPQDRIEERKGQHRAAGKLSLPHVIEGADIAGLGEIQMPVNSACHAAFALASGSGTGPARIVLDPVQAPDLGANYILICPSTDPAWTPLFVKAAGLILERGGALSHGAIVARELGVPAVVLENATRLFSPGETLTLDANQGRVLRRDSTDAGDAQRPAREDAHIAYGQRPPAVGQREGKANQLGLCAALVWAVLLGVMYLLPAPGLRDPIFALIDAMLWPLVRNLGMVWTVTVVGACFAIVPLMIQRWATDNARLLAAKKRAIQLQKAAKGLPDTSMRRKAMLDAASPTSLRTLKASMASMAWVLGPMMTVFLWMPERMDPASWNADPGGLVTVVAELDGEYQNPVTCVVTEPLSLEALTAQTQTLPPIRATLEDLRQDWQANVDLSEYPWQLQTAGEQAAEILLSSLNSYLAKGISPQKLTWMLRVPDQAAGHYPATITLPDDGHYELTLAFGKQQPPTTNALKGDSKPLIRMEAVYPRALQQRHFWRPLRAVGGPAWDFGWLGAYIISYLLVMLAAKRLLRVA